MYKPSLLFSGFAVIALAAAAQQGTTLRHELKENATEVYKFKTLVNSQASSSAFDGDLKIDSSMTVTLKMGKLDAASGQVAVDADVSDISAKADGSIAQYVDPMLDGLPKEMKVTGKLDARNRFAMDPTKTQDAMITMVMGTSPTSSIAFVEFPDKPVNLGDTWTFPAPKNPIFGKEPQTLTAKFIGEKEFNGALVWCIDVTGKLKVDANMADIMKGQESDQGVPNMTMKGTADVKGEAMIDKATG
ncbi:MAG TPA: hypothetical protein VMI31_06875, partial [Fimbriimonadaceae bacterium]|nr:hypothetical protein [Fimbriimonadaceae bacterium]